MSAHNELGKLGEGIALTYLLAKGFRHRISNWSQHWDKLEVDLVMEDGEELVVVEVKTYTRQSEDLIWDKIYGKKEAALHLASERIADELNWQKEMRIDVVLVQIMGSQHLVQHLVGAL